MLRMLYAQLRWSDSTRQVALCILAAAHPARVHLLEAVGQVNRCGGATHLACAQLLRAAGVNLAHLPYLSAASGLQDMVAGVLDMCCPVAAGALSHIEAGIVKAFAASPLIVFGRKRTCL